MANFTLFSQIIQKIERTVFKRSVKAHQSDKHNKGMNTWTHLCSMLFCHFSKANSLREICNGLKSTTGNLNHIGVHKAPPKSTLAYANEHRNWQVFQQTYYDLLGQLNFTAGMRKVKFRIKSRIFLLDSSTISLCLSLFDWAKYRQRKGAVKLHTLLDYDGCLPHYMCMTDGKPHDVTIAKQIQIPAQSVVVADRAYLDFSLLYTWHLQGIRFVVRLKTSVLFETVSENDLPEDKNHHILKDEIIRLTGTNTPNQYPQTLRRVAIYDQENNKVIEVITNQMTWTASTIAELYKQRWQIEIFFKEIKQHLCIKSFVGTSQNAVLIQIWTALITLLLLKYLKAIGKYNWCLSNLIAFLRMNLFSKIDLHYWLNKPFEPPPELVNHQLKIF